MDTTLHDYTKDSFLPTPIGCLPQIGHFPWMSGIICAPGRIVIHGILPVPKGLQNPHTA